MKTLLRMMFLSLPVAALMTVSPPLASPAAAQETDAPTPAQVAQGARYWATQCQRCHNLRDPGEFTDDIWDVSVNHMRIRGNIPADQIRAIKAFLKSSN